MPISIVLVIEFQKRQRQSVFVIQIALSFQYAEPRGHKRRKDFFGGRFADRTGHAANPPPGFCRAPARACA
jgi:hypothetical protein